MHRFWLNRNISGFLNKAFLHVLLIMAVTVTLSSSSIGQGPASTRHLEAKLNDSSLTSEQRVDLLNQLSYRYIRQDPNTLRKYANEALELSKDAQYPKGQIDAYKNIGNYHAKIGARNDSATYMFSKALSMAQDIDDHYTAAGLTNNIAMINRRNGKYRLAMSQFLDAQKIYEDQVDTMTYLFPMILTNIAETYAHLDDIDKAQEYYNRIEKICSEHNYVRILKVSQIAAQYINYKQGGNPDSIKSKLLENLQWLRKSRDHQSVLKTYNFLIEIALDQNRPLEGLKIWDTLQSNYDLNLMIRERCRIVLNMSRVYHQLNNSTKALELALRAKECSEQLTQNTKLQLEASQHLYDVHFKRGQYNEANKEYLSFIELNDKHLKWRNEIIIDESEALFSLALRDRENQMLREKEISQGAIVRYLIAALSAFVLMTLLVTYFFFRNKKTTKKIQEQNGMLNEAQSTLNQKNKDLEKYIESNIQLEQFAHIASHDLKSPIRTIKSFIGLLQQSISQKLEPKQNMYMQMVSDGADDMYALVNDLLSYSKANSLNLTLSEVDIAEVIGSVTRQLSRSIQDSQAEIEIVTMPKDPILCDRLKLKQVIQNLLSNSIKFVPDDRVPQIKISYSSESESHRFYISDNGIGIDDSFYQDVFAPFKRLNTKTEYPGSGLGLPLVKKIIEKHKGKIWIEPNSPHGCVFVFDISKDLNAEEAQTTTL